jgi:16S rRNA (uracil1498-N3)-methyltransferase
MQMALLRWACVAATARPFLADGFIAGSRRRRSVTRRYLNRILFTAEELNDFGTKNAGVAASADDDDNHHVLDEVSITLPKDDYRTIHVSQILKLQDGDTIRSGIVSCDRFPLGLSTDNATVHWGHQDNDQEGCLCISLRHLEIPTDDPPPVSLILALPRPLQLGRILPMVSQMGVEHLVLTNARKVPKDYFGSHLIRDDNAKRQENLNERLMEGLTQSGDVRLPQVHIVRKLHEFLDQGDLDRLFPRSDYVRLVAHPFDPPAAVADAATAAATGTTTVRTESLSLRDAVAAATMEEHGGGQRPRQQQRRIVVAVGPEGGWEEPRELQRIVEAGFQPITMGSRILRTDCAVIGLLALAHDACRSFSSLPVEVATEQPERSKQRAR